MHPVLRSAIAAAKAGLRPRPAARVRDAAPVCAMNCMRRSRAPSSIARRSARSGLASPNFAARAARSWRRPRSRRTGSRSNKPFPAFAMTIPEFDGARYSIWRHASGTGRKDILTFGEPGGATAMVEIHRPGQRRATTDEDITASISELRLSGAARLAEHHRDEIRRRHGRGLHRQCAGRRAQLFAFLAQFRRAAARDQRLVLQCRAGAGRPRHRLEGPWQPVPGNPVMVDVASARPAGTPFTWGDRLVRPVQDCVGRYGAGLGFAVVDRLDAEASRRPWSAPCGPRGRCPACTRTTARASWRPSTSSGRGTARGSRCAIGT